MRSFAVSTAVLFLGACAHQGAEPDTPALSKAQIEAFGSLANFVGMTMTGAPTANSGEQLTDVQSWEWALGGKAILIRHALADGSYGGKHLCV